MNDDLLAAIRKQLDQGYPDSWRWDENGPEIIGYAVRLEEGQTQNGAVDILVLEHASNGTLYSVWLMHESLRNKLYRAKPKAGDLIGIRQLGERVSKNGRTYMDYGVVVHGAAGNELTWDAPKQLGTGDVVEGEVVEPTPQREPVPAAQYAQTSTDDDW